MLKKLTLLAMTTTALFAFVAPPVQAEGPLLTNAPTYITAASSDTLTHTSVGTIECTTTNFLIYITENAGTTVKGHGTGEMKGTPKAIEPEKDAGHCGLSSSAVVVEVTNVTISDFHLTKHGAETTGTTALSYTFDLRSATGTALIAECTLSGTLPTVKTGMTTLSVAGEVKKTAGGAFCPNGGSITGEFIVTIPPIVIH